MRGGQRRIFNKKLNVFLRIMEANSISFEYNRDSVLLMFFFKKLLSCFQVVLFFFFTYKVTLYKMFYFSYSF